MKRKLSALIGSLAVVAGVVVVSQTPAHSAACDRNATTATFASEVSAATAGQTICLANGNYGTWAGTNKAITIQSASGQGATIALNAGSGDVGFTLQSLTITRLDVVNGARDITVRDSRFTGKAIFQVQNSNILLQNNTHNNINTDSSQPARIRVLEVNGQHNVPSGVTVRDSQMQGGDADGFWTVVGATFIGNRLQDICDDTSNGWHTDHIQVGIGPAVGVVIQRNFILQTVNCTTQYMGIYDGLVRSTITDNVVKGITRPFGIELFSDDNSTVAHNTLVYGTTCFWNLPCGSIDITSKTTDDPGFGTRLVDNILSQVNVERATLADRHHNMVRQNPASGDFIGVPQFVGGANPTTYDGFCLAANSPGKGRASDGLDVGIRCNTAPPTTTATTTPPPSPAVPTAEYTFSPASPVTGQQVTFNSAPSACAASPCTYKWEDDAQDGPAGDQYPLGTGAVLTFTFQDAGVKNVRLTVTDSLSRTATVVHPVTVTQPVTTAAFTWSPTAPAPGQSVTFDATTSTCAATPCSYTWQDDGPDGPGGTQWALGTGQVLTRSFSGVGTKFVRLIITDAAGATATVEHDVIVR